MTEEEKIEKLRSDFSEKLNDPDFVAKLIAAYVRNNMEEFHGKHLSDGQMKELNPLIRDAIYTALLDIGNRSSRAIFYAKAYVPEYWEGCEYVDKL